MKATLSLINLDGEFVQEMTMDQDDWSWIQFPNVAEDLGLITACKVAFADGLTSFVSFKMWKFLAKDCALHFQTDGVLTEEDFRKQAIAVTGWKPMQLPERLSILKLVAEENRAHEPMSDMQWQADILRQQEHTEGFGRQLCPVPCLSEV